jgi:hypothetical protein
MPRQVQTALWGTPIKGDRAQEAKGWYQRLRDWRVAYTAARRKAKLASLSVCWDSRREVVTPLRAEAAPETAAAHAVLSAEIMLYGLSQ